MRFLSSCKMKIILQWTSLKSNIYLYYNLTHPESLILAHLSPKFNSRANGNFQTCVYFNLRNRQNSSTMQNIIRVTLWAEKRLKIPTFQHAFWKAQTRHIFFSTKDSHVLWNSRKKTISFIDAGRGTHQAAHAATRCFLVSHTPSTISTALPPPASKSVPRVRKVVCAAVCRPMR